MPLFLKAFLISGVMTLFCTTKVSEWVLLNTEPEKYLLVYHHNQDISDQVRNVHRELISKNSGANVDFQEMKSSSVKQPYYALYYRKRVVRKYNSYAELLNLTTSPLRQKISNEIMSGKLCVMFYLKTDNPEKDNRGRDTIQKALALSPFREIITFIELSRNSQAEGHLVSMLLNVENDLKDINEPMLFGIFGRFKALEPLLAGGITTENIGYMINFLTADCSCLIKDELPGSDILYAGKWENPVPALLNKILDENPSLIHL